MRVEASKVVASEDADCDGFSEGGLCCPFAYAHSSVTTLNDRGSFNGSWYVSKSDPWCHGCWRAQRSFGNAALRRRFTDLLRLCEWLKRYYGFFHVGAVVAAFGQTVTGETSSCPANCTVSVELDVPTVDEATMETESSAHKLVIHPTAGVVEQLDPPCSIIHLETLATSSDTIIAALCADRFVTYRVVGGILQPEVEESAVEAEQYRWIGPPIKRIVEGRLVTDWLTASGEDFVIKAWRLSAEGIVERPLSTQLQNMDASQREIPMREAISEGGYIARVMQESKTLERWTGTEWMVIPRIFGSKRFIFQNMKMWRSWSQLRETQRHLILTRSSRP